MTNREQIQALAQLLLETLNPLTNKKAEESLLSLESHPDFLVSLFSLIGMAEADPNTRFAGAVYFKNFVRKDWYKIQEQDRIPDLVREHIKDNIVDVTFSVPDHIQLQLTEALHTIMISEAAQYWHKIVQKLYSKVNVDDFKTNIKCLMIFFSFLERFNNEKELMEFKDDLPAIIGAIVNPLVTLLRETLQRIQSYSSDPKALQLLFESVLYMLKIYLITCQHDIPQIFLDNKAVIFGSFHDLLLYQNPSISTQDTDEEGILEKIRTVICEICQLYYLKYREDFDYSNEFLKDIWDVLSSIGPEPKYDALFSKAIAFITTVVKRTGGNQIFDNEELLTILVDKIIVPNCSLRESDIEVYEDDPIDYVRREVEGTSIETRRHSCEGLIRALVSRLESKMSNLFMVYNNNFIEEYKKDPVNKWMQKNAANFLFNAIVIKASTVQLGATQIISGVNVEEFFTTTVLPDLDPAAKVHPILKLDALKFVSNFRYHLKPEHLLSLLPTLITHLAPNSYVVYTFASICIERILFIKANNKLIFTEAIIKPHLESLLGNLFNLAEMPSAPEKVAENEFILKAVMRTIIIGKETISHHKALVSQKLSNLLSIVSRNPSNPRYNHYLFECIGAVVRNTRLTVNEFEASFWLVFQEILASNIEEFVPYTLQIISQLLTYHKPTDPLPKLFETIWAPIAQPPIWESKGNVPALTKLVNTYISNATGFVSNESVLRSVLGIYNKLLFSKLHYEYAFIIIKSLFYHLELPVLDKFIHTIFLKVLQILKAGKSSATFTYCFTKLICSLLTSPKPEMTPDTVLSFFNRIDPNAFNKLLGEYILPTIQNIMRAVDRTTILNGFIILLTRTSSFFNPQEPLPWIGVLELTVKLVNDQISVINKDEELESYEIDDSQFQNNFVKLATASSKEINPAERFGRPESFLIEALDEMNARTNGAALSLAAHMSELGQNTLSKCFERYSMEKSKQRELEMTRTGA